MTGYMEVSIFSMVGEAKTVVVQVANGATVKDALQAYCRKTGSRIDPERNEFAVNSQAADLEDCLRPGDTIVVSPNKVDGAR